MTDLLKSLPPQMQHLLWRDPRMRQRLAARAAPGAAKLSGDDRRVLAQVALDFTRLRRLAGLVWHGRRIAQSISRAAAAPLAAAFTPDEIAFALDLKLFAPASTGPQQLTATAVEARGAALLKAWSRPLGAELSAAVDRHQLVTAPEPDMQPATAAIILQAVAYRLEQASIQRAA